MKKIFLTKYTAFSNLAIFSSVWPVNDNKIVFINSFHSSPAINLKCCTDMKDMNMNFRSAKWGKGGGGWGGEERIGRTDTVRENHLRLTDTVF